MANLSDKLTNKKLVEMETHIADIYRSASDELQKKANAYFDTFAKRYEIEHDAYLAGAYTDNEFKMWYLSQVGRGERWQQLKTNMANEIGIANETAIKYINGQTPGIYALNANVAAYEIEKGTGIAFDLVNEEAVERLFKGDNHSEFRVLSRNPQRDYEWNRTKIQDSLLSGILQGESIDKIANRFLSVMGSNEKAAVRNARTAVTSAQNGGRQHTFNKAEDMGIEIEKEWIATQDSRTRDSHMHLDGVVVKNNEEFPNGLMYPGDPDGEPAEVYNCRCTMRAIIPKYNGTPRTDNTQASYHAWSLEKQMNNFTLDGEGIKIYDNKGGYYGDLIKNGIGSAFRGYPNVDNPFTGEKIQFVPGSRPYFPSDSIIAGKGCKTGNKIGDIERLVNQYKGTDERGWQKRKAQYQAYDEYGEERTIEIHYYYHDKVGRVEDKVKFQGNSIYVDEWPEW